MADVRQRWTAAGSLLLGAAIGFSPAAAQPPLPISAAARPERTGSTPMLRGFAPNRKLPPSKPLASALKPAASTQITKTPPVNRKLPPAKPPAPALYPAPAPQTRKTPPLPRKLPPAKRLVPALNPAAASQPSRLPPVNRNLPLESGPKSAASTQTSQAPALNRDSPPTNVLAPAPKSAASTQSRRNVLPQGELPPPRPVASAREAVAPAHPLTVHGDLPAPAPPAPSAALGKRGPGPITRWWLRCRDRCRDAYWGYPEEFEDARLGASVAAHASMQTIRGQGARMALYQYDFLPQSDQLKPRGRATLVHIAECAPRCIGPVFIEPTPGRPDLDEARRLAVWEELQGGPFAIPSEQIVIGTPVSHGLGGADAILMDKNRLQQTSSRGATAGGGGGGLLGGMGGGIGGGGAGMSTGMSGSTGTGN